MESLHISLAAEQLFSLFGSIPVTNSLLTTWLVMAFLIGMSVIGTRTMRLVPGYLQSLLEVAIEGLQTMIDHWLPISSGEAEGAGSRRTVAS